LARDGVCKPSSSELLNTDFISVSNRFQCLSILSEHSTLATSTPKSDNSFSTSIDTNHNLSVLNHKNNTDSYSDNILKPLKTKGLKICNLNIRSMVNKMDQLRLLVKPQYVDIFTICETWLDPGITDEEISIDGYTVIRNDRNRHGGGVAIYIRENIPFEIINNKDNIYDIEILPVIINLENSPKFVLSCIYRPPSASQEYFNKLIDCLESLQTINGELIIIGDLNIHYEFDENLSSNGAHYIEKLLGCKQLINKSTRITNNTETLIDHIYTSFPERHSKSGVIETTISDHFMIYTVINFKSPRLPNRMITMRDYKRFNTNNFIDDMSQSMESILPDILVLSTENAWHLWLDNLTQICNKHAPIKSFRLKNRNTPWISKEIIKLMYERDHLHKKAKKQNNDILWNNYRISRNNVTTQLRLAERKYYEEEINKNKGKTTMWKTLNTAMGRRKHKPNLPHDIIPEKLNKYYSQVGAKLAAKFTENGDSPDYISQQSTLFKFKDIDPRVVVKLLQKLPDKSKLDIFSMDTKLLRLVAEQIAPGLTHIFSRSLKLGTVLPEWKQSRITPVYKGKGDINEFSSYRPISVLPHIVKIIEKLVHDQLLEYLLDNKILSSDQSAYLKHHSTQTSLHKVIDDVLESMNNKETTHLCCFDLSKCFDTINHNILLKKLSKYGIIHVELTWFTSYLDSRTHCVTCNGTISSLIENLFGVPQGSNLGPLLFLLFSNDIPKCLNFSSCNLYADDTIIYKSGKNVDTTANSLQQDVNSLIKWFENNKLTLNIDKSCTINMGTRQKLKAAKNANTSISINNTELKMVDKLKYLGVTIDNTLSWEQHIDNLCTKISPKVELLRRIKYKLGKSQLIDIYNSIVQPHIDYCITVWGYAADVHLNKIQRIQNRAARIITNNYDWSVRGLFLVKQLGWYNIKERRDYFMALQSFKANSNLLPEYICKKFTPITEIHNVHTRSSTSGHLIIPKPNCEIFKQSLNFNGPRMWNSMTKDIRDSTTVQTFKSRYKKQVDI